MTEITKEQALKLSEVSELLGKAKEQKRCTEVLMAIAQDETQPIAVRNAMLTGINAIIESDK
jgi:hypothetical protein